MVEFVDIITERVMNSNDTNSGGWPASELYSFVNNDLYTALPNDLKDIIIDTYAISSHSHNDSSNFKSYDKIYLLYAKEIWGNDGTSDIVEYDNAEASTRQLDYYLNNSITIDNHSLVTKNDYWWTRSVYANDTGREFCIVDLYGSIYYESAMYTLGVAPAFRIG